LEWDIYLTGYVRSGDTYTANGTAETIKEIVAQLKDLSADDAGIQFVITVQDGLRRGNRIPSANQDPTIEVHISGGKDHQNGEKCDDEAY
jgi:hypothetical protein